MMRVAALTSGIARPSTRFRVRQYVEPLAEHGVEVRELVPAIDKYARLPGWPEGLRQAWAFPLLALWTGAKLATRLPGILESWGCEVTWLQRELLPGWPTLEGTLKKPLVLDLDDAVWLSFPLGELALRRIARRAAVAVAGNAYLADWLSCHCDEVRVIPTAIDTERFHPRERPEDGPFTVGWTGLAGNFTYLRMFEKPLRRFFAEHRDARFLVMAERPLDFPLLEPDRIDFWPWSEEDEVRAVQAMDVGLMPLPDDDWTRGKCSFKMLQYMACGVPAVVSPVGMNREVLDLGELGIGAAQPDDWYEALNFFYRERDHARECGHRGREVAQRFFERRLVSRQLAEVFQELAADMTSSS